ncbi:MAG: MBL fold metallo-hydrolase [Pseudomonadota bacterium]
MRNESLRITTLGAGITAIDTDYVRPQLDASHLIVDQGRAAFVDTGTNSSVPNLLQALAEADIDRGDVDYVFLTHVHLDHAGGAGLLMQSLPNARAVLHPRGARHMASPEKLTLGAMAVYGEAAFREMYGELVPIDAERLVVVDDGQRLNVGDREVLAFFTEGHARHHYCLHDPASDGVFTGDSFGISYRELDTAVGAFIYPTTTPVQFDPPAAHAAVDRIAGFDPQYAYLTHYSAVGEVARLASDMHRRLDAFVDLAVTNANASDRMNAIEDAMRRYLLSELRAHGATESDETLIEVLRMDLKLNTMGLEHWLDNDA